VVPIVISKAVKSLTAHGVQIDREQWIKEAEQCERNNQLATCQAIIKETIGQDIDEEDKKKTWCDVCLFFFSIVSTHS
jgi:pre-mRNA-processing factor 6